MDDAQFLRGTSPGSIGEKIRRGPHSLVMPGEYDGTGFFQPFELFLKALRVFVGADDRGDDGQAAAIAGGNSDRLGDGRRKLCGRVGVRAVAQDDVQQEEARLRIGGLLKQAADSQFVVQHGVQPPQGELVASQVDHCVPMAFAVVVQVQPAGQRRVRTHVGQAVLQDKECLRSQRSAGIESPQAGPGLCWRKGPFCRFRRGRKGGVAA